MYVCILLHHSYVCLLHDCVYYHHVYIYVIIIIYYFIIKIYGSYITFMCYHDYRTVHNMYVLCIASHINITITVLYTTLSFSQRRICGGIRMCSRIQTFSDCLSNQCFFSCFSSKRCRICTFDSH